MSVKVLKDFHDLTPMNVGEGAFELSRRESIRCKYIFNATGLHVVVPQCCAETLRADPPGSGFLLIGPLFSKGVVERWPIFVSSLSVGLAMPEAFPRSPIRLDSSFGDLLIVFSSQQPSRRRPD